MIISTLVTECSEHTDAAKLPYYNTADFSPLFLSSSEEINKKVKHVIPAFSFTDQNGNNITDKEIDGKIHIANFIFTSCISICPVMTRHLKLIQSKYYNNPGVVMLSFSVTPWIDDVRRLKKFAVQHEITSQNWHLLTGNKSQIYTLARKSYFAEEYLGFTKDSTQFLHTEHIILVDKNKRIRGIYNGTLELEVQQLSADIRQLLKE
ncbi:SCO family protein [Dyadobacter sp. CY356]|uniref:SCO family protein n=1 Tax=Dyadobacter sp. CY356 TaxID=2906442 RepID=UPI001F44C2AC|nr:SCO family protein [Dyadobacter sp. CY356]MCF0058566.1 SCO family protein [Dyadobacter sp. CY356]